MNALEKNIAIARGEALAAHLLASAAIQAASGHEIFRSDPIRIREHNEVRLSICLGPPV